MRRELKRIIHRDSIRDAAFLVTVLMGFCFIGLNARSLASEAGSSSNNVSYFEPFLDWLWLKFSGTFYNGGRIIHNIKLGIALVLVSLLYLVNSMFKQIGENAMWAIMTVVMFELYAGATLSKGINRGIGTLIGGGLGCLAAVLAAEMGGINKP